MTAHQELAPLPRPRVLELVAQAVAARDEGMRQAEEADRSGLDIQLIDQAIGWFAQTGQPFSANDFRDLLPADVRARGLMGARFSAAYTRQEIRPIGERPSTKRNTHAKRIGIWVRNTPEDDA